MTTTNYFLETIKLIGAAVLIDTLILGAIAIPAYRMVQRSTETLTAQEAYPSYIPMSTFTTNHIPLLLERGFKIRKLEGQ